jgi:hypothetical protein
MNVAYEDKKLHNDGIFDSLMGYKEWFHYLGAFSVKGKPLTFMLGFPMSYTGMGAFGWISFDKKQYSLAGNLKDVNNDGFYELQRFPVHFESSKTGYTLEYVAEPEPGKEYRGVIKGDYPHYTFDMKTPDISIIIKMTINEPQKSVFEKEVFEWMPFNKRLASWFHSGDVTISLKGTIGKDTVETGAEKSRGWYERMWSKVVVLWPSEWLWFMTHLDSGAVFDLYTAVSLGIRVHPLDECWLYKKGVFHEFSDYKAEFEKGLKEALKKKKFKDAIGKHIYCTGKEGEDSFNITATITDFRQYEFQDYSACIKYTNFVFETEGEAVINGDTQNMKGRGSAEWAPMKYWWL